MPVLITKLGIVDVALIVSILIDGSKLRSTLSIGPAA